MARLQHEIRTHLNREDKPFAGLTFNQLFRLAIGAGLAYLIWNRWLAVPLWPRTILSLAFLLAASVCAIWRPGGRALDEWLFILIRYQATPRYTLWRPRPPNPAEWQSRESGWVGATPRIQWNDGARDPDDETRDDLVIGVDSGLPDDRD